MEWPGKVMVATVLITGGFLLGFAVGDDPPPPAPAPIVKTVPKYVEREKVVTKKVTPSACLDAIKASRDIQKATDEYEQAIGELPNLLDDSYRAIHEKDLALLNELKTKEIKLEATSVAALLAIREAQERLNKLQPKCDEALR